MQWQKKPEKHTRHVFDKGPHQVPLAIVARKVAVLPRDARAYMGANRLVYVVGVEEFK